MRKGNLKNSFKRVYKKSQGKVYAGFSRPSGAAAHLVDRGTVKRWTKKGYYRGYISKTKGMNRGSSFWTDAVEDKGPEGLEKLYNSIRETINNNISKKKANKKNEDSQKPSSFFVICAGLSLCFSKDST